MAWPQKRFDEEKWGMRGGTQKNRKTGKSPGKMIKAKGTWVHGNFSPKRHTNNWVDAETSQGVEKIVSENAK